MKKNWMSKWTQEELDLLGTMTDSCVGKILGIRKGWVFKKRKQLGIKAYGSSAIHLAETQVALLGKISDEAAAKQFGVSETYIWNKRQQFNITPFKPKKCYWTPANIALLGTLPDKEVAEIIGCSHLTVVQNRQKRGIASWQKSQGVRSRLKKRKRAEYQARRKRVGEPPRSWGSSL